jgi:hypothetical protein
VAYYKTARLLENWEQAFGADSFRKAMKGWFETYKFRHVQPEDFHGYMQAHMRAHPGIDMTTSMSLPGLLPNQQRLAGTKILSPFSPQGFRAYLKQPSKHAWLVTPVFGLNKYDKFMPGLLVTNYLLPPSKWRVLAIPLYGTGSKQLNGLARLSFTHYPDRGPQRIEFFTAGETFSNRDFTDDKDRRFTARFYKFVPGVDILFRNRDPRSHLRRSIQWKSYFIGEQPFRISLDSVFTPTDTTLELTTRKQSFQYAIQQLSFRVENDRALYPYSFGFSVQHSSYFTRLQLEANYFFNYPPSGGLQVRLFAGKLVYDRERTVYPYGFNPQRYFLNMSGAGGDEDYTYSNYFVGRNEFEGFASQQIMIRDGAFKMRTPLLASPVGQSDDWLAAVNFNTTIPEKINPLALLPFKIPLHLFLDIGTHAGAWQAGTETDRFLFDAGLHLPLLKNTINLYFPLLYSKEFVDYSKSIYPKNRFFKTMTFSIDLQNLSYLVKNQRIF